MTLTDEHRSMIATAYLAGRTAKAHSLCCADDALKACAAIVGHECAAALQMFAYERLTCRALKDEDYYLDALGLKEGDEDYYLDAIGALETLP